MDPNKLKQEELEVIAAFKESEAWKVFKKYLILEERNIHEASHRAQDVHIEQTEGHTKNVIKRSRESQIDENQGRTIMIHNLAAFVNQCAKRHNKVIEKKEKKEK